MDEKNRLNDEVQAPPKQGSGSLLAAERKKQSRTVEEIADELNLSVSQIRTIESDQSEGLPEPTYVRGYIRAYARLLGMDPEMVLEHYLNPNWQRGTRLDDMPRGIGSANEREKASFFTPGKVVATIVVLSLLVFLWMSGQLDKMFGGDEPQVSSAPSQTTPANEPALSSAPIRQNTDSSQTQLATPENLNPDPLEDNAIADDSSPAVAENKLSLSFSDTTWVDIRDVDGERLAYKNYAQGEDLTLTASTPISVFIGNARAVSATLNDQAYDISQYTDGVFARFVIGE